jgi:quercetin dioxygenase-like cupin family protein
MLREQEQQGGKMSRLHFARLAALFLVSLSSAGVHAQQSAGILRAVLANTPLATVTDAPRHFRLARVTLPPRQASSYEGPVGFVFVLSGTIEVGSGAERQQLARGDAALVPAGGKTALRAGAAEPAVFLHFVLAKPDELGRPMEARPATVTELQRTDAIPALKPGPHELTLVRTTFPARQPSNPFHHRSGAALYYVLGGAGLMTVRGAKPETRPAGGVQYEPSILVHQWANPGDVPLVLIQANISQEGVPQVIFDPAPAAQ